MLPDSPHNQEAARLKELQRYQILDTEPEAAFERLVELAQRLFDVPIVLINLLAEERQWFKASRGGEAFRDDLKSPFCHYVVEQRELLVVPDATQDPRFQHLSPVAGPPHVRFYAGAPLKTSRGHILGVLCLVGFQPRTDFDSKAQATLSDLAALAMDELELRLLAQERQTHAERVATIFESITDAFYTLDDTWRFTYLNAQAEKLLRRSRTELLGRELWREFPETVRSPLYVNYLQAVETQTSTQFEFYFPPLAGWFEVRAYPFREGLSVYFQDISARKESTRREALQTEFRRNLLTFTQTSLQAGLGEGFYQTLLENAVHTIPGAQAGSLLVKKDEGHQFIAAVGFDLEALGRYTFSTSDFLFDLFDLSSPEPQLVYAWQVETLDDQQRKVMEEYGLSNAIAVTLCVPIIIGGETVLSLYLDNFDTKDAFSDDAIDMARVLAQQAAALMQRQELEATLKAQQEALEQLAHYDPVTGLPNRRLLDDRLEQAAAQSRRHGRPLTVMFLDLDNFKQINDTYGHAFGDQLIAAVATRLAYSVREGDTLARWGGDEFTLVLPDLGDTRETVMLAERLLEQLQQPFLLGGRQVRTNASIGIDVCPNGLAVAAELVQNADTALYRAKAKRGSFQFFTEQMKEKLLEQVELGEALRSALDHNALTLHYQPRINLLTGKIASLEALARWQHPTKGWISPTRFIPLAEELGLIRQLGAQMLEKACAQAKQWYDLGLAQRVAVNLAVEQLLQASFVEDVQTTLHRYALAPNLLELEITESTAMTEVETSTEKLLQLRELGVHLSIDDFGTAYSSLAYLNRLPVHCLKIDRSFIQGIGVAAGSNRGDHKLVQAILALGKSLGLCVVAEGVETEAQRLALVAFGCDEAQGYLFAPPQSAEEIQRLLESNLGAPY